MAFQGQNLHRGVGCRLRGMVTACRKACHVSSNPVDNARKGFSERFWVILVDIQQKLTPSQCGVSKTDFNISQSRLPDPFYESFCASPLTVPKIKQGPCHSLILRPPHGPPKPNKPPGLLTCGPQTHLLSHCVLLPPEHPKPLPVPVSTQDRMLN